MSHMCYPPHLQVSLVCVGGQPPNPQHPYYQDTISGALWASICYLPPCLTLPPSPEQTVLQSSPLPSPLPSTSPGLTTCHVIFLQKLNSASAIVWSLSFYLETPSSLVNFLGDLVTLLLEVGQNQRYQRLPPLSPTQMPHQSPPPKWASPEQC